MTSAKKTTSSNQIQSKSINNISQKKTYHQIKSSPNQAIKISQKNDLVKSNPVQSINYIDQKNTIKRSVSDPIGFRRDHWFALLDPNHVKGKL